MRRIANGYVVAITNTPALVQIFLLYYALPDLGLLLEPMTAVLIGLVLNAGAYLTEILRAGVLSVAALEHVQNEHTATLRSPVQIATEDGLVEPKLLKEFLEFEVRELVK